MTQFSPQQQAFIHHFLYTAYANMEMEGEVSQPFNLEQLYLRYKTTIDSMIHQGIYRNIKFITHEGSYTTHI